MTPHRHLKSSLEDVISIAVQKYIFSHTLFRHNIEKHLAIVRLRADQALSFNNLLPFQ